MRGAYYRYKGTLWVVEGFGFWRQGKRLSRWQKWYKHGFLYETAVREVLIRRQMTDIATSWRIRNPTTGDIIMADVL